MNWFVVAVPFSLS